MKTYKYNFLAFMLLFTTILFAQKQDKKVSESFKVNKDVVVEISTRYTDVKIETWNKNEVSVQGTWQADGFSKDEANKLFDNVNFEALGNKNKVVIISKSKNHHFLFENYFHFNLDSLSNIGNLLSNDFHFNFDSIANIGNLFSHDFHFELPEAPEFPELPEMPEIVTSHLSKIEFDHKAYEKDKEGYLKKFEKQQEDWQAEFEEKIEPQMKAYENKIEQWEKKHAPKMKKMEEKMAKWEKANAPKMRELEKKMEKMGGKMEKKYDSLLEFKHHGNHEKSKVKKNLVIKVPKDATVIIDARHGSVTIPDDIKTSK